MDYKEKIREHGSIIWHLDSKLRNKWIEIKQTLEHKEYKQPKREYEQSKKLVDSYKRQAKKHGIKF